MFNVFDFFIALETNLMNGKLNKVLENLHWLFLPDVLKSFCLSHTSQMFIKFSECLWTTPPNTSGWLAGQGVIDYHGKIKSPSNSSMCTWCCRLCKRCSCTRDEEAEPVPSRSCMTRGQLSAYTKGPFTWQHTKGSRVAALAPVCACRMYRWWLCIPLCLVTKDRKDGTNHFPSN